MATSETNDQASRRLWKRRDPSDRLIVATALTSGLPLITADSTITGSGLLPIVW